MKPPPNQPHGAFIVDFKQVQADRTIQAAQDYLVDLANKIHCVIGEIEARQDDLAHMENRYKLINSMLETLGCAPKSKGK